MEHGLIHIYTGDGKGKSTAACGLAVRARGAGKRVIVVRFLKSPKSGSECKALQTLGVEEKFFETGHTFIWDMNKAEKARLKQEVQRAYEYCLSASQACDLLIADEIIGAMHAGFLSEEQLLSLMREKGRSTELVLTGRNASEALIALADYVSEIRGVKHPFEKGIEARKGIEF